MNLRVVTTTGYFYKGIPHKDIDTIMETPIVINADGRVSKPASHSISFAMDKKEQGFEVEIELV